MTRDGAAAAIVAARLCLSYSVGMGWGQCSHLRTEMHIVKSEHAVWLLHWTVKSRAAAALDIAGGWKACGDHRSVAQKPSRVERTLGMSSWSSFQHMLLLAQAVFDSLPAAITKASASEGAGPWHSMRKSNSLVSEWSAISSMWDAVWYMLRRWRLERRPSPLLCPRLLQSPPQLQSSS